MNIDVGDVFKNRMNEDVEVLDRMEGSYDIKVKYDGKEFTVPKTMLKADIDNGTLRYAYTIARGPTLTPRKMYEESQVNPHLGCRHNWKVDSYFSANKYETCTICGKRKEDL